VLIGFAAEQCSALRSRNDPFSPTFNHTRFRVFGKARVDRRQVIP
jgi:hypothetical protein